MKFLPKIVFGFTILLLIILGGFFAFRNSYLQKKVNEKLSNYNTKHGVNIAVREVSFDGFSSIELAKVSMVPHSGDTLLWLGNMHVSVDFWAFVVGKLKISNLELNQLYLRPKDIGGKKNYDFLLQKDTTSKDTSKKSNQGYAALANRLLETVFNILPSSFTLTDFRVSATKDSLLTNVIVRKVDSRKGEYDFWAGIYENGGKSYWHFQGKNDKSGRNISGTITRKGNKGNIPALNQSLQLSTTFQNLDFSFSEIESSPNELALAGSVAIKNWQIEHWRLSPKPIHIPSFETKLSLKIGDDYLEIDSTSSFMLGNVTAFPFFNVTRKPSKIVVFKLKMPETAAQDFFDALPKGLFSNLDGIQVAGKLNYMLDFSVDLDNPKNVHFDADLKRKNFKIVKMGATNLGMMNGEFFHTAYEKGVPVKTFTVGESNSDFVKLEKISPLLQQAVLSSEDGSFFGHGGFNMDAFQSSITANIVEKRFVRGASTISMQLVKNVFLTRNKTLARKLEEILIVWLIENLRLTSKERMFEVYLNVIEWGPGIYGIGPASQFYFNKSADYLTLNESIFLSCIIPSPKWFKYRLDSQGKLKQDLYGYYRIVAGHLVKRGIITEEIKTEMIPGVEITGPAKSLLNKVEVATPDSVELILPEL